MIFSAPGKVMLFGEYAVLHGARALVAAVDRRVTCVVDHNPGVELEGVGLGRMTWAPDLFTGTDFPFARAVFAAHPPADGLYRLDSRALHAGRVKLGLGSSAASTVALAAAIGVSGGPAGLYAAAQAAHRAVQGTGSGADVAAAAFGGVVSYRWLDGPGAEGIRAGDGAGQVQREPRTRPRIAVVWTGRPASTTALVGRVHRFAEADPERFDGVMGRIASAAERGLAAWRSGANLLPAVDATVAALAELGAASGAPIVTDTLRRLDAVARGFGARIKPTGAGGGDLGWIVGPDPEVEAAVLSALVAQDQSAFWLAIDARGAQEDR